MKLIAILLAVLGMALADREDSLRVINSMRELQPIYEEFQTYLVKAMKDAKTNASNIILEIHSDILVTKEKMLRSAINRENKILDSIGNQNSEVDRSCLKYLNDLVETNINLAGHKFSTCITKADANLNQEIEKIFRELDKTGSFQNISIYDVFQQQNIFNSPKAIITLLEDKKATLEELPVKVVADFLEELDSFRERLSSVKSAYRSCLDENDDLLRDAFVVAARQLKEICNGEVDANDSGEAPAATEATISVPEDEDD